MIFLNIFLLLVTSYNFVISSSSNNKTELMTASYSRVSHWNGLLNKTHENEGRSSKGQLFYTQRTDAKVSSGQNLRTSSTGKRVNNQKYEHYPGIGEVIQDRFNPRPYFDYVPDSGKVDNSNTEYSKDKQPLVIVTSNPPLETISDKPPNTYGSPFTSYNPGENEGNDKGNAKDTDKIRPTVNYDEAMEYDTPPTYYNHDEKGEKEQDQKAIQNHDDNNDFTKYHFSNVEDEKGPSIVETEKPSPIIKDYSNYDHHESGHSIKDFDDYHQPNEDMDLNPPPPDSYEKYPKFYPNEEHLFDYDHHQVYHEVKMTTTTTPAPKEHERVNQAHYSYYYLGRKLFYIPLYFSVYFIVYVTILILKSIARHKVQFVQHFDDTRSARYIDTNKLENNVSNAIYVSSQKYMM